MVPRHADCLDPILVLSYKRKQKKQHEKEWIMKKNNAEIQMESLYYYMDALAAHAKAEVDRFMSYVPKVND